MSHSPPRVTELEQRLAGAEGETLRDALVKKLEVLEDAYRRLAATGLSRADLLLCLAAAEAAASAIAVLGRYPVCTDVPPAAGFLH